MVVTDVSTTVPDASSTMALFGIGFAGVAMLRRRRQA